VRTHEREVGGWNKFISEDIKRFLEGKGRRLGMYRKCALQGFFIQYVLEDKMEKLTEKKYQCKICNKVFRTPLFVGKHISNKHKEFLEKDREYSRKALQKIGKEN